MKSKHIVMSEAIDKSYISFISSILAGILISIGSIFMLNVNSIGLLNGIVFSIALISIVFTGSSLFTGQCLYQYIHYVKYKDYKYCLKALAKTWIGNFIGCSIVSLLYILSQPSQDVINFVQTISSIKTSLLFSVLLIKSIFCNFLVCLALLISIICKDNISKIFAIIFCVTAFVACGFEHSIANMSFLTLGLFTKYINLYQMLYNIVIVTVGNIIGACILAYLYQHK